MRSAVLVGLLGLVACRGAATVRTPSRSAAQAPAMEAPLPSLTHDPDPGRDPSFLGPAPAPHGDAFRAELVRLMRHGLRYTGSRANMALAAGRPTIFDGSYDWHSCVIANWALLVDARWAGEPERAQDLVARATPAALAGELFMLAERDQRASFTRPYPDAWFALYLSELERHVTGEQRDAVRAARVELEGRLWTWMDEHPFPEELSDKMPPICGFYRSWLWAWLLLAWSQPCTPELAAGLDRWRAERIEPAREAIAASTEPHGFDFLYVPMMGALVERLADGGAEYEPGAFEPWPESVRISTVHVLGVEISRTWPLAVDAGRGDEGARQVHRGRVSSLLARDDLWRGEFDAVSHWIPQYLWIGYWLEHGRP